MRKITNKYLAGLAILLIAFLSACDDPPTNPDPKPPVKTNILKGAWALILDTTYYLQIKDTASYNEVLMRCGFDWNIAKRPCQNYTDYFTDSLWWVSPNGADTTLYKVNEDTLFIWAKECIGCPKSDTTLRFIDVKNDTLRFKDGTTGITSGLASFRVK